MNWIDNKLYKKILDVMPICCVDVCIIHMGMVLLVKRADPPEKDSWWLPGGRLFKNESLHDCAIRKCKEEVGLDCDFGFLVHTQQTEFPDGPMGTSVHSVNLCYSMFPKEGQKVKLDKHCLEYKWFGCIEDYLHPYVQTCMTKAGIPDRMKERAPWTEET